MSLGSTEKDTSQKLAITSNGEMIIKLLQVFFHVSNQKFLQPKTNTAKNIVVSPNFLVWKFCGKAQFPHPEMKVLSVLGKIY